MGNQKKRIILNLILLMIFLILFIYITLKYSPAISKLIKSPEKFEELLNSYGGKGILVFILFQVLQVVIAAIPGELVQVAGGYVYGLMFGTIYSVAGILIGSIGAFYLSRIFGYRLVKNLLPRGSIEKFEFLLGKRKTEVMLFILFLIPGIPKDVVTYIAGMTPIDSHKFFFLSIVGRLPGIFMSALIGANMREKQYTGVVIICALVLLLSVLGIAVKDRIIKHFRRA